MPVPNNITDLDTTASMNSPQGGESPKGTVDNYLRAHAAFIRQNYNTIIANAAQTALDISAATTALIPAGTRMLFAQTSAPVGWTKDTTHNNKALRLVSGAAGLGGTHEFTNVFTNRGVSGSIGNTWLTVDQIPPHSHTTTFTNGYDNTGVVYPTGASIIRTNTISYASSSVGGGGAHSHSFTGTAIDMSVQYVDVIIGIKN